MSIFESMEEKTASDNHGLALAVNEESIKVIE